MMFEFKVTRCPRTRAHEWTLCPYAHAGEKAARTLPGICPLRSVPRRCHRWNMTTLGDDADLTSVHVTTTPNTNHATAFDVPKPPPPPGVYAKLYLIKFEIFGGAAHGGGEIN